MPSTDPHAAITALLDLAEGHRAEAQRIENLIDTFCTCDDEEGGLTSGSVLVAPTEAPFTPRQWDEVTIAGLAAQTRRDIADIAAVTQTPPIYVPEPERPSAAFERLIERSAEIALAGDDEDASRVIDVEPGLTPTTAPERVAEIMDFAARTGVTLPDLPPWEYGTVAPCGTGPRIAARRRGNVVEFTDSETLDNVRWIVPGMDSTVESFQAFSS